MSKEDKLKAFSADLEKLIDICVDARLAIEGRPTDSGKTYTQLSDERIEARCKLYEHLPFY